MSYLFLQKTRTFLAKKWVRNEKRIEEKVLGLSLEPLIETEIDTEAVISISDSSLDKIAVSEFGVKIVSNVCYFDFVRFTIRKRLGSYGS